MKNLYRNLAILALLLTTTLFFGYSSGPASVNGNGYTGAPGESFTCGGCHNSGVFGEPTVTITVSLMGTPVTNYVGGQIYDVSVSVSPAMGTPAAYGFQSVILRGSDNTSTGVLVSHSTNMKFITGTSGRRYMEHSMRSIPNVFTFEWMAPDAGTGDVTIYSVGNTVNSANGNGGDNGSNGPTTLTLSDASLPVELTNINARAEKRSVELTWVTATEDNVSHFEVERSSNGEVFTTIDQVQAQGFSQVEHGYKLMDDAAPTGTNFYRLRMVDLDGTFAYSPVVSATVEAGKARLGVFPNPTQAMVRFSNEVAPETNLVLRDGFGRQLWTGKAASGIDLSPYPTGVYLLEALIDGERTIERIVKQ